MAGYIQSVDPYRHPVTTSDEKPLLPEIAILAPHWYTSENESDSDLVVVKQARVWKRFGKPVIVGQHGNMGMNWDPKSGSRMRIRLWTALFQEIALVFWNTSWAKNGMNGGVYRPQSVANIYLGPEERNYVRVLSRFSSQLDAGVRMMPAGISGPAQIRAYGLASDRVVALYLHRYAHEDPVARNAEVAFTAPDAIVPGSARWIDPATGSLLGRARIHPGVQSLPLPPFNTDAALLLSQN
jgi:hypothetical protein